MAWYSVYRAWLDSNLNFHPILVITIYGPLADIPVNNWSQLHRKVSKTTPEMRTPPPLTLTILYRYKHTCHCVCKYIIISSVSVYTLVRVGGVASLAVLPLGESLLVCLWRTKLSSCGGICGQPAS